MAAPPLAGSGPRPIPAARTDPPVTGDLRRDGPLVRAGVIESRLVARCRRDLRAPREPVRSPRETRPRGAGDRGGFHDDGGRRHHHPARSASIGGKREARRAGDTPDSVPTRIAAATPARKNSQGQQDPTRHWLRARPEPFPPAATAPIRGNWPQHPRSPPAGPLRQGTARRRACGPAPIALRRPISGSTFEHRDEHHVDDADGGDEERHRSRAR